MILFILFLILSIISLFIAVIFYIFKNREWDKKIIRERNKSVIKYVSLFLSLILITLFSFCVMEFNRDPSFEASVYLSISGFLMVFSFSYLWIGFNMEDKYVVELDYPSYFKSRKGDIKIGKVMHGLKTKYDFYLSLKDLTQHMFITGTTGSGKTTFLQYFLMNFKEKFNIPFLLAEFKGEYQYLQGLIEDVLVIKAGENFTINIFDPEGIDPQIHAQRVFQIFKSGGFFENVDYSPQMEKYFVEILERVCKDEKKRSWEGFHKESQLYKIQKKRENRDLSHTIEMSITAIETRIRRYSIGVLRQIFGKQTGILIKDLFDYNVILDLSSLIRLGGEKQHALFFLNMILKYLWDRNLTRGSINYEGIRHLTIIEDAQYFAPQDLTDKEKLTTYLEDIALLLRGTGECLISLATHPSISRELLANAGVIISFQTHIQKSYLQELLNFDEKKKEYLSMLGKGYCIIRLNSIEKPFILKIPPVERKWLTCNQIDKKNQEVIEHKLREKTREKNRTKAQEENRRDSKAYCKLCGSEIETDSKYCTNCLTKLEEKDKDFEELQDFIEKLYNEENT